MSAKGDRTDVLQSWIEIRPNDSIVSALLEYLALLTTDGQLEALNSTCVF